VSSVLLVFFIIIIFNTEKKLLASSCYEDKCFHFFFCRSSVLLCPFVYFYDIFLFLFSYIAYKISIRLLIVFCDSIRVAPFYRIVLYLCLCWGHSYEMQFFHLHASHSWLLSCPTLLFIQTHRKNAWCTWRPFHSCSLYYLINIHAEYLPILNFLLMYVPRILKNITLFIQQMHNIC